MPRAELAIFFLSTCPIIGSIEDMCLKEALKKLNPMLSENRKALIASVIASRSNSVSLLLENVHNEANENAVLRTMDAFGYLNMHRLLTKQPNACFSNKKKFRFPPRSDAGARNWVCVHEWTDTRECVSHLKGKHEYVLAVASPKAKNSISAVDFNQKLLIAFGNEKDGISEELAELSDMEFSLPMCGFVESFNISVSAAITLYHAYLHRISKHVCHCVYAVHGSKLYDYLSRLVGL